jgi:adenylate cyclase
MTAQILVVDDEPDMKALVLQKFRHQIGDGAINFLFASDGIEALAMLEANSDIDMVVADINMPRMDGLTLLHKLRESAENVSTIIVSAYGDMSNIRAAMNRGAFDFVTKPIDFADLEKTIAKTMRHIEVLREARQRQDLCGQRREIATVFSDITDFTALVETLEPGVLGTLLNDYLTSMTDIVFAHDGTVTKIVGDALHILFGAPGEQPDHADRAVSCSLALDEYAQSFRERWQQKGVALGITRIGVHAGPAIVGNFGGGRFFDYTAYGDTINVASRLEVANKQLGTRILVSSALADRVANFRGRPVGDLILRGRTESIRAFEPFQVGRCNEPVAESYQKAFAFLEAADPCAMAAFAAHVGNYPSDQLASFHLKRLLSGTYGGKIALD